MRNTLDYVSVFLDRGEFGYQLYALADNGSVVGPMLPRKITIDTLVAHTKGQLLVTLFPSMSTRFYFLINSLCTV